jgi:hypothetical protein
VWNAHAFNSSAITYKLNGGRFGDNVAGSFTKGLYLSWRYELPLIYERFPGSDELCMHELYGQQNYDATDFAQIIKIDDEEQLKNGIQENTLYVVHFYTKIENLFNKAFIEPEFGKLLKQAINPRFYYEPLDIPSGYISVAVHVRKGSGPDKPLGSLQLYDSTILPDAHQEPIVLAKPLNFYADYTWPTKFPPDQYYIDQIIKLSELFNDAPLYVHIFTDAQDAAVIAHLYKEQIKKDNIIFGFRTGYNQYSSNVVQDYYHMAQCDCLIRSSSLYAKAVQLLGNHQIVIYPVHGAWIYDRVVIDKVGMWQPKKRTKRRSLMEDRLVKVASLLC